MSDVPGAMILHNDAVRRLRNVGYDVTSIENDRKNRIVGLKAIHPLLVPLELKADCFNYCALDIQLAEKKASDINADALTREGR